MDDSKLIINKLKKINDFLYEIPQNHASFMRVPARIFSTEALLKSICADRSLLQLINVAALSGIQKYAFGMPDIHQGYGFPIGGVAATAIDEAGVISPGGIGYDINCGVRLLATSVSLDEIQPYIKRVAQKLYETIPSGIGHTGPIKLTSSELNLLLEQGAPFMIKQGYGVDDDIEYCEENGVMNSASHEQVSSHAKQRGLEQIGTLGSGNHFLEVQYVEAIFDKKVAEKLQLHENKIMIMIHCGSRGLGHQVCSDHVRNMIQKLPYYGIELPDKELACAPVLSADGEAYFAAMSAAANFAWANRHTIGSLTRTVFKNIFGESCSVKTVYDVSHNIGKKEIHKIDGIDKELLVHRKGATRAFGPHQKEVISAYKNVGQPVFIPGTMGTASYVLVGSNESMDIAFGSSCHGAGRALSRIKAKQQFNGKDIQNELRKKGIIVQCDSLQELAEEAPLAYKNIEEVIMITESSKLAKKVARLKPLAVIKGN